MNTDDIDDIGSSYQEESHYPAEYEEHMDYDPYKQDNPYMPKEPKKQNYGTEYNPNYNGPKEETEGSIMAEFFFSISVLVIIILVAFIIHRVKLFLKKRNMLSPLMARFLDAFQTIFTKTATKVANKKIASSYGIKGKIKTSETSELVQAHLTEGLQEELYVAPNAPTDVEVTEVIIDVEQKEIKEERKDV